MIIHVQPIAISLCNLLSYCSTSIFSLCFDFLAMIVIAAGDHALKETPCTKENGYRIKSKTEKVGRFVTEVQISQLDWMPGRIRCSIA
jgi:hypothetical protein